MTVRTDAAASPVGPERVIRLFIFVIVAVFGFVTLIMLMTAFCLVYFLPQFASPQLISLINLHYKVVIGLPIVGVASFLVVSAFSITQGRIELSGFGVTFKGASGPLIFWVIVFLAVSTAMNLMWQ